jgi:hypothetical protein
MARIAALIAGLVVFVLTWRSVITTLIIPRSARGALSRWLWIVTYWAVTSIADLFTARQRRDSVMSFLAPINLLLLLHGWIACFVVGYALIMYCFFGTGFQAAIELAGSSVFTLGIVSGSPGMGRALEFAAAASGMIVIGLQVGYLPAIYGAYSARENLVTQLRFRCGFQSELSADSLLAGLTDSRDWDRLADLFMLWEGCAAAITESHVSYPWLMVFRSPVSNDSWISSMLTILDVATLLSVISPLDAPPAAAACARACKASLERLASIATPFPSSNRISQIQLLTISDFAKAYDRINERFFSAVSQEEAFLRFCAERERYEPWALALARFTRFPLSGWLRPCNDQSLFAGQPQRID